MKIAFLLYPIEKNIILEDTSFWIMWELCRRGHEVFIFESHDLSWRAGAVRATVWKPRLHPKKGILTPYHAKKETDLKIFDCIFVRKEPPFDTGYLYALQLLDLIRQDVFILNDPQGVAMSNEKTYALEFSRHTPETLVTENAVKASQFIRHLKTQVVLILTTISMV